MNFSRLPIATAAAFVLTVSPLATAQAPIQSVGQTTLSRAVALLNTQDLALRSSNAILLDSNGNVLYERDADEPRPIASITKLMTAMVILDAQLALDEKIQITKTDRDLIKRTGSRLSVGATLTRATLLKIM